MRIPAFPKIYAFGHRQIKDILNGIVEITEKVDGSQLGFGKVNDEPMIRSKGKLIVEDAPDQMFSMAVAQFQRFKHLIPDNMVFWGEYLRKPKHNVLAYDRTPKNNIALFGGMDVVSQETLPYDALCNFASDFDIDVVPLVYSGIANIDAILGMLERESYLGGETVEGVVVKRYEPYEIRGMYVPLMAGKYVREKFKEKLHKKSKKESTKVTWENFKEGYRTEARWWKAIQHLREQGYVLGEPKDIGPLIKEIKSDIIEEEMEVIKQFLWNMYREDLLRKAIAGFPEWYKEKLARGEII